MNIKNLRHLLPALLLLSLAAPAASQLEFINFPTNLTLPVSQTLNLSWHGQDSYVNISLARFYYFGDGSVTLELITTFNTAGTFTWTPESSLQQGIYAFFIWSTKGNASESPFFALTTANSALCSASAAAGLSDVAKVGIGVGVSLGLTTITCLGFIFWREKTFRSRVATNPAGGSGSWAKQQRAAELESNEPIHELRTEK